LHYTVLYCIYPYPVSQHELFRSAPDYSIDTESELTRRSTTGNCEWRTCPRSLRGR